MRNENPDCILKFISAAVLFWGLAAPMCSFADECGWRRVGELPETQIEWEETPSQVRSLPRSSGSLDLGLANCLPASGFAFGNCTVFTNAEGHVYRMTYDALGRMTSATNALGECVLSACYDGAGNLLSRTDGEGNATTFDYDPCKRCSNRLVA